MLAPVRRPEFQRPNPGAAQASRVASFYTLLVLVGFFWHAMDQDSNDVWRTDSSQGFVTLLWTPVIGVMFGMGVVKIFRLLELRMSWLPELHGEFRSILGRPMHSELVLLAAASAIGEEVLFRGAMLDAWGVWWSSLIFALLHIPPRKTLWPWTVSAFLLGLALTGLTWLTGNLGAAVAAHFVINWRNLAYITRNAPAMTLQRIRPATAD